MEKENLIEQTTKYPKFYRKKEQPQPPLSYLPNSTKEYIKNNGATQKDIVIQKEYNKQTPPTLPLMLPCKYGALYSLIGRPIGLKYNSRGMATIKEPTYTAQFGKSKAQVWLKSFQGASPHQILFIAKQALNELSKKFERKFKIKLTLIRIYNDIEWAETSKKRSKKIAEKAGISKGGKIKIGEAIHKFDDFSHPEFFQINPDFNATNRGVATEHAKTHYYLYMRLPQDIEKFGKLFGKIADSMTVLNQKVELINTKVEKKL